MTPSGLTIAVDARELGPKPTGVGRYLASLLDRWAVLPEAADHRFVLYTPVPLDWPPGIRLKPDPTPEGGGVSTPEGGRASTRDGSGVRTRDDGGRFSVRVVPGDAGTWWEQVQLPRALAADHKLGRSAPVSARSASTGRGSHGEAEGRGGRRHNAPDVLFAPAYSAPVTLRRIPFVLTIHDLSFYAHPEWFPRRERVRRQCFTRWSSRCARLILTDSEFSRGEIARFLSAPDDPRLRVVRLGASLPEAARPAPASRAPTILFVGSLFNRRRIPDLIAAFARVARQHAAARLEIVGDDRTFPPQPIASLAAATGLGDRIRIRSYVPDAELARLYATAALFVFLSEYEGFGLTPLEALGWGVPLVVLDTPVAREVYGDAARFVRAGDIEGTAAAMLELLGDEPARAALADRGRAVLSRYSWDEAARATLAALEEAAGRR